jgi:hypothetical protein
MFLFDVFQYVHCHPPGIYFQTHDEFKCYTTTVIPLNFVSLYLFSISHVNGFKISAGALTPGSNLAAHWILGQTQENPCDMSSKSSASQGNTSVMQGEEGDSYTIIPREMRIVPS